MVGSRPNTVEDVVSMHFEGLVGNTGYDLMTFQQTGTTPDKIVFLKGGLGDPHSILMELIATEIVKQSDGEVAAGTIGTIRPINPVNALISVRQARKQRSQSVSGAIIEGVERFKPESIIVAGQSEGGISILDGVKFLFENKPNVLDCMDSTLLTMNTPGVYGELEYDRTILHGLAKLALNCIPDLVEMTPNAQKNRLASFLGKKHSLVEGLYTIAEIEYLRSIDASQIIQYLRTKTVVKHMFHQDDIVSGAEVESDHSEVYLGRHIHVLTKSGAREAVSHMLGLFGNDNRGFDQAA